MTARVRDRSKKGKLKVEGTRREQGLTCTHFWVIERPLGPTSKGVCKYCDAVKEFSNEPSASFNPGISFQQGIPDEGGGVFDGDYGEDES